MKRDLPDIMPKLSTVLISAALTMPALFPESAIADRYRLVMGDQLIVDYDFLDNPKTATIDLDGEIRLAELGSIPAAGLTLDELEAAIAQGIAKGGFSGASYVSAEISAYAPVVVSGFVERAGRYDYLPGMTVASAMAVAGGLGSSETGPATEPMAFAAGRRAAAAADDMVRAAVAIAGLEAALASADTPIGTVPDLPGVEVQTVETLMIEESARLTVERARAETLLASWAQEVQDFGDQMALLNRRIELKTQSVANLEIEVNDLEKLRAQGLATTSRTSTLQQRLSDDREELLALEIAKVQAGRNRALAERRRDEFTAQETSSQLASLRDARANLIEARRNYELAVEEMTLIGSLGGSLALMQTSLAPLFVIQGPRADRFGQAPIDLGTSLLPGDILLVEVRARTQ